MASHNKKSNYIHFINTLSPELKDSNFGELESLALPHLKNIILIDDIQTPGMMNFNSFIETAEEDDISNVLLIMDNIDPDDATNIQFTSGTTGHPKGATLSHFNIINDSLHIGGRLSYSVGDRVCLPVPFYHCFGMVLGNLSAINYGAAIVIPNDNFSAKLTLEAITEHKCTSLYGVPTMFIEYFKEYEANPGLYQVDTLKKGIMAGSLCPQDLMNKLIKEWKVSNIQICYGLTEASPVFFQTSESDSIEDKCQTVGTVFPHCESKLINSNGDTVPLGEKGEICVRGFGVMKQYWEDERATREAVTEDKWLKTGDLGQFDSRGYLRIVGRIKEMIIRGGENIYPREIEEYIRQLNDVEDVQVVGIPDFKYGEETFCLLKKKEGSQMKSLDIYHHCHGQIAHFKIPKYVKFVDSFPQTVTGKYQKFKMIESILEEVKSCPSSLDQYKIRHY